jgi:hypothetical protein
MTKNNILLKVMKDSPHLKHILTSEKVKRMCLIENRFPFVKLPVCSGCERLGLWTHSKRPNEKLAYCDVCGTYTVNPRSYAEYLSEGLDIDSSGHTFRSLSEAQKTKIGKDRVLFIPDK